MDKLYGGFIAKMKTDKYIHDLKIPLATKKYIVQIPIKPKEEYEFNKNGASSYIEASPEKNNKTNHKLNTASQNSSQVNTPRTPTLQTNNVNFDKKSNDDYEIDLFQVLLLTLLMT